MIKNNEFSKEDVEMFYQENMKIGIPIVHDRGTDIIIENDYYFYNFIQILDKLRESKRGLYNLNRMKE